MLLKTYMFADEAINAFSCTNENVVKVLKLLAILFNIAKILVPMILIVTGIISLAKATIADDQHELSKAVSTFFIKLVIGVFIFFLPTILVAFMDLIDGTDEVKSEFSKCSECILDYSRCPGVSSSGNKKNNNTKKNDNSTTNIIIG